MDECRLIPLLKDPKTREPAFNHVVDLYKERLYWQIRRMVLTHEDADDVLQNTFIKAWQGLDAFRGEAQFSTWLFRIAANETLNFLEKKRSRLSIDDEAYPVAEQLESDPYFDGDETERQLQQAIAGSK